MDEIIKRINSEEFAWIGIRHLSESENYKVGDYCRNSYDWDFDCDCSTYYTDDPQELDGTCAYNTEIYTHLDNSEEIEEKLIKSISRSNCYAGKAVVIAGDYAEYGTDDNEIIIQNAKVIGILN